MRLARPDEAPLLAALHAPAFPPHDRWDATDFGTLLAMPGTYAVLAEGEDELPLEAIGGGEDAWMAEAGRPAGMVTRGQGFVLTRIAGDEAEILTIAVLPRCRRAGLGLALMEAAQRLVAQQGATMMFLEVAEPNLAARGLYGALGFEKVGRRKRYYANGDDALVLRRLLGPEG